MDDVTDAMVGSGWAGSSAPMINPKGHHDHGHHQRPCRFAVGITVTAAIILSLAGHFDVMTGIVGLRSGSV